MYRRVSGVLRAATHIKYSAMVAALAGLVSSVCAQDAATYDAELLAPKSTETSYIWSEPEPFVDPPVTSETQTAKNVRVANQAAGRFVSAFHTGDPTDDGTTPSASSEIYVSYSDTNGNAWSEPQRIAAIPGTETSYEYRPDLQSDQAGTYLMVYDSFVDGSQRLYSTRSTDDGASWAPPVEISLPGVRNPRAASIATNTVGTWMTAFIAQVGDEGTTGVVLARSTDEGLTWQHVQGVSAVHEGRPQIRVNPVTGLTVVVFERPGVAGRDIGYLVSPDFGQTMAFGTLNTDGGSDNRDDYAPRIDFNDESDAWVAVWGGISRDDGASSVLTSRAVFTGFDAVTGGFNWSAPAAMNASGTDFGGASLADPWIASDHAGNWIAAWSSQDSNNPDTPRDLHHVTSYNDGTTWTLQSSIHGEFSELNLTRWSSPVLVSTYMGHWLAAWINQPPALGQTEGVQTAVPWNSTTFLSTGEGDLADLQITGTLLTNPVYQSLDFRVRYRITNNGPLDAHDLVVQLQPPHPPISAVSVTGPPEFVLIADTLPERPQGTIAFLEAGKSIDLTATFNSSAAGTYVIRSMVTANEVDPNESNNIGVRTTVHIEPAPIIADLSVTKTSYPEGEATVGEYLGYTITVRNLSNESAPNVVVEDPLPEGLKFNYAATSQGTWSSSSSNGRTTVTAYLGTIGPGARATLVIATTPQNGYSGATNVACASFSGVDPDLGNNCGEVTVTWDGEGGGGDTSDVSILKTVSSATVDQGSSFTYTLRARNHGPAVATGVLISDTLPDEVEYRGETHSSNATVTQNGQQVTAEVPSLAVNEEAIVNIAVVAVGTETVYNTATVTTTSSDPDSSNNSSTRSVYVDFIDPTTLADLNVTKSAAPSPGTVGTEMVYSLAVGNLGPADATDVVLEDLLPESVAFQSATVTSPDLGTETSYSNGRVTYTVADLPSGTTASLQITVMPIAEGEVTNTASASGPQPDIDQDNNSASVVTTINGGTAPPTQADLATTSTVSPSSGSAGNALVMTIQATNLGPQSASDVVIKHTLATTTTLVSASGPAGSHTVSGNEVQVPVGLLGPGVTKEVAITLIPQFNGPLVLDARISGHVVDPVSANNEAYIYMVVGEGISDLPGTWLKIKNKSRNGVTFTVKGVLAVKNDRTVKVPYVSVYFYLSDDEEWDRSNDTLFAALLYKNIKPGKQKKKKVTLKPATDPTGRYIIAVIDRDGVSESIVPVEIPPVF